MDLERLKREKMKPLHCCDSCKGLFLGKSVLATHQPQCDSTISSSPADMFAVDKSLLLSCLAMGLSDETNITELSLSELSLSTSVPTNPIVEKDISSEMKDENEWPSAGQPITSELALPSIKQTSPLHTTKKRKIVDLSQTTVPFVTVKAEISDDGEFEPRLSTDDATVKIHDLAVEWTDIFSKDPADTSVVPEQDHSTMSAQSDEDPELEVNMVEGNDNEKEAVTWDRVFIEEDSTHGMQSISKSPKHAKKPEPEGNVAKFARLQKYRKNVAENTDLKKKSKPGFKYYYQCPFCRFSTVKMGMLDRHMRTMHSDSESGSFKCEMDGCSYTSVNKIKYKLHLDTHKKPAMCDVCGATFTTNRYMERHKWKHTGEEPFLCDLCPFKSRFKEHLKLHLKRHEGITIKCDEPDCAFVTLYPSALKSHKEARHTDTFKFSCGLCSYETNCKQSIAIHIKNHQGLKEFSCSFCDYKAASKKQVTRHIRSHTKEKVYFCDLCDYSAGAHSTFQVHMQKHFELKPFQCSICNYQSVMKTKIRRHISQKASCFGGVILTRDVNTKIDMKKYYRPPKKTGRTAVTFTASDITEVTSASEQLGNILKIEPPDYEILLERQSEQKGLETQQESSMMVVSGKNCKISNSETINFGDGSNYILSPIIQGDGQEIVIEYNPESGIPDEYVEITIPKAEEVLVSDLKSDVSYVYKPHIANV